MAAIFSLAGPALAAADTATTTAAPLDPTTVALALRSTDGPDGPTTLAVTVTATSGVAIDGTVTVHRGAGSRGLKGCRQIRVDGLIPSVTVHCTVRLPAGISDLSASFAPAPGATTAAASSPVQALTLASTATSVRLQVPAHPTVGATVTYTASVAPDGSHPAHLPLTGTVAFTGGGQPIAGCRAVRVVHLRARCHTRYTASGSQRIAAAFSGDDTFSAGTSPVRVAQIRYPRPIGAISAQMRWTFHYTKRYTEIQALRVKHLARGSTVTLSCRGKWCPLSTVHRTATRPEALNLDGWFYDHGLKPGVVVTIAIQRLRYTGKYYRFRIRAAHPPAVKISCLAQGSTRPGVGCGRP